MPLYGNLIFRAIPFFRKVAPISCPWRQTAYGCCFRTREQKGTPTLRQYQSASLLNLLCFVSFTGENPTSSFLSLSLSWVGVKHGIYPALQFGERNLGIPPGPPDWIYIQSFKQLSASIPTHHPWCTAYLHSKCLMLNLSGIPCERTNNLSEWHKDYIKVKISELQVQKEIFPELLSD